MKLEVGMYVRSGMFKQIGKYLGVEPNERGELYVHIFDKFEYYSDDDFIEIDTSITKASFNIIDLIEVGDYVNGYKVTKIHEPSRTNCNRRIICCLNGSLNNEIKKVLTHEQYEANCYKVGE